MPRGIPLRSCSFATCQVAPAPLPFWIFFLGNHHFLGRIMVEWQDSTMKIMSHIDLQNRWIFHDFSWNGKAGKAPLPILWMALWQRHLHSVWCASHHSWKRWCPHGDCPMCHFLDRELLIYADLDTHFCPKNWIHRLIPSHSESSWKLNISRSPFLIVSTPDEALACGVFLCWGVCRFIPRNYHYVYKGKNQGFTFSVFIDTSHPIYNSYVRQFRDSSKPFNPTREYTSINNRSIFLGGFAMIWATLWLCQNSYWKWPFIVSFPIKNCDFP